MNILVFSSNSPYSEIGLYEKPVGGAEINLRLIAEELVKLNHNVYYYSTIKMGLAKRKNINGVDTYHYPCFFIPKIHKYFTFVQRFNEKIVLFQKRRRIEKIIKKENIDIIHTYSTYPDTYISIIAANKYKIPVVQQVTGRAWYNILQKNPGLKDKIKWSFNNVNKLIFVSDFIKDQTFRYFKTVGFNVNTSFGIEEIGINYDKFENLDVENVKSRYSLSGEERLIFCAGAFKNYSKRQDILIHALPVVLEKFDNVRLVFAGDGPNLKSMKDLAVDLNVGHKVSFLGIIPHSDLLAIMSLVEIVAHPTVFESFCNILKESFALGKAFLVSDIEPLNTMVKNGDNGLLADNSSKGFADKIIYLMKNEDKRKSIEKNAFKYAKKRFDSKINIKEYEKKNLDIYQNYEFENN